MQLNNKLITFLKKQEEQSSITQFEWKLENPPIRIPQGSSFERNVYLKENLKSKFKRAIPLDICYWIVNGWGGIGSFKKNYRNDALIPKFVSKVRIGKKLSKSEAGCLSSLSKIASFVEPTEFSIYDSRAIFSLNWLLIKFQDNPILFPQPRGRGPISELDINTIILLSSISYSIEDYKTAYYKYCDLMKELSGLIYGERQKPYLVEMLLFKIAVDVIRTDINVSTTVVINRAV